MKTIICPILFTLFSITVFAQTDSLTVEKRPVEMSALELENKVAELYQQGRYNQALPYAKQWCLVVEKEHGKNSEPYSLCAGFTSKIYEYLGQYEIAIEWSKIVQKYTQKAFGKNHPNYLYMISHVAHMYAKIGQSEQALTALEEPLKNLEEQLPKNKPIYDNLLNTKAYIYWFYLQQYHKALPIILSIDCQLEGDTTTYLNKTRSLAYLYERLEQYEVSRAKYEEAMSIIEHHRGKNHHDYVSILSNFSQLLYKQGEHKKALEIKIETLSMSEKLNGKNNQTYIIQLNNLASMYNKQDQPHKAIPLYEESFDLANKNLSKNHPYNIYPLHGLANSYLRLEDYNKAHEYFQQSIPLTERIYGKSQAIYWAGIKIMASLYERMDSLEQSVKLHQQSSEYYRNYVNDVFDQFSEEEQGSFGKKIKSLFTVQNSFAIRHPNHKEMAKVVFNNSLMSKGLLLGNRVRLLDAIRKSSSKEVNDKYEEWEYLKRLLSREFTKRESRRRFDFDSLNNRANFLESDLARLSSQFKEARQVVSWKDIEAQLTEGEAAIEFVHFNYYPIDTTEAKDQTYYIALILRKGDTSPTLKVLFEEKEIAPLLDSKKRRLDYVNKLYNFQKRGLTPDKKQIKGLYELIWAPIEDELANSTKIYYSPSGLLNRITLSAIPVNVLERVGDFYDLRNLGSTRQLLSSKALAENKDLKQAIVFGGIQYNRENSESKIDNSELNTNEKSDLLSDASRSQSWRYLPWTDQEVTELEEIMVTEGINVQTKRKLEASESTFKQIGIEKPSPHIIHLATHGYFFPDPKETEVDQLSLDQKTLNFKASEHPMIRSGLILAGGNQAWNSAKSTSSSEDGILTAYEIAQMNLQNTELVVLSACETGLGDIEGNEGVYGLQRAFKIAGAKYLIMSLWQVPDRQTQELMKTFYTNWLKQKMPIREALSKAKETIRDQYENPYYWAGFVLLE